MVCAVEGRRPYWKGSLVLKMRDLYESAPTKSLSVVLEIAGVIIGSMSKAFPVLEPVKAIEEEIAEARMKYGGDKPLLTALNISGRGLVDWDSKANLITPAEHVAALQSVAFQQRRRGVQFQECHD